MKSTDINLSRKSNFQPVVSLVSLPPGVSVLLLDLDAPKDLEVSEATETTLLLVWTKPMAKIDIYRLVFVSAEGRRAEVEVPGGANTHTLVNLTPGMTYTISLVAERARRKSTPATITASTGQSKNIPENVLTS